MKKFSLYLIMSMMLAACTQSADTKVESVSTPPQLNGEYKSADGKDTLIFSSEGKVTAKNSLVGEKIATYSMKDGKVSYQFSNGFPRTMTVNNDGSLISDSGTKFEKQE